MPMSTQSFMPCSKGSSMPSPTDDAARLAGAPVGRLHRARAAAGDDREAGLRERGAELARRARTRAMSRGRARRAEDADRPAELGERAEAFDELGLDAQHAPRVGVDPVGRAARVEQPLVVVDPGGTCRGRGRTLPSFLACCFVHAVTLTARGGPQDAGRRPSPQDGTTNRPRELAGRAGSGSTRQARGRPAGGLGRGNGGGRE